MFEYKIHLFLSKDELKPNLSILIKGDKSIRGKGNLYIKHLEPTDAGVYRCLARNGNGEEKTDINLILQG